MRVGLMLAAAAAMVCALPAGAQTFTEYEIVGTGTLQNVDQSMMPIGPALTGRSFVADFYILTSPSAVINDAPYYLASDGSTYTFTRVPNTGYGLSGGAQSMTPGNLTYRETNATPNGGTLSDVSVNFAPNGTTGFPTNLSSYDASGTFFYNFQGSNSYYFSGTIQQFGIVGTSSTPQVGLTFRPGGVPALPEPASWLLMIAGVGMLGVVMRRRSVKSAVAAAV